MAHSLTALGRIGIAAAILALGSAVRADPGTITALGRIEPRGGVLRVAGPSRPAVVIRELRVEEGDRVEAGQIIALLDSFALSQANVDRLRAELDNAERELRRVQRLSSRDAASEAKLDEARVAVRIARANLAAAEAELEMSHIKAPIDGQVLEVHARAGERLGPAGVVELGRTDQMVAVAEVYETDIARVREGQRSIVTSPALPGPVEGVVERIGLKIGKLDLIDADPVAKTDARVVEVEILLADAPALARLTNLQVDVEILP